MTTVAHSSNHGLLVADGASSTIVVPAPNSGRRRSEKLLAVSGQRDAMIQ